MADDNSIIVELIASGKDEFVRSLTDSANSASNLTKKIDVLDKSLDENNKTTKDYSKTLSDNTKKVINNNNAVDKLIAGEINARTAVRELKKEMIQLAIQGKQNSAEYLKLKDTLGNLSDTIGDVSAEISQAGSDTRGLDQTIRVATTLTSGFSVLQGATALFGTENKKLEETLVKVNSLMLVLNGLQQIQEELKKKDTIFTGLQTGAQRIYAVAVGQSTGAMLLFRQALLGLGIGAIIAGVYLAVKAFQAWNKETNDAAKVNKILADSRKEATQNISNEIGELTRLTLIAKNENLTKQDRQNAIKQINDNYPEYLGNINLENIGTEKTNDLINDQINLLVKRGQVKILTSKLAEENIKKQRIIDGLELDGITKIRIAINKFFGFQKDANRIKNEAIVSDYKNTLNEIDFLNKALNKIFEDLGKSQQSVLETTTKNTQQSAQEKSKVVLNELEKLKAELQKKQKELETEISRLVVKDGQTESKLSIDLRANITGIEQQIKVIEDLISNKPIELQIDVSPQVSFVGESLKLQIEDLKKEIQFLFNDIFTSGEVPLANPQLQSLLAQLKEAEENLKIFEDAYNAIFEQFTDDGVQLPPLLDEFDIDNFTSSIGELTSIGKDKYKEYYDYIQSLREQDIINEEIANDAIQKLNESRQNTIIERANVAKDIYSEFANVITGITDTISQASKQRYEQDVAELEQKKERGIISEKQYQREVAKLQKEQALREYRINVTKAFMQVPMVVLNALTTVPFPANIVLATLYGGIALAQAALVAKNKPKFRDGGLVSRIFKGSGLVKGNSHEQGGVNAELEGNEFVIKKRAVDKYGVGFFDKVNNLEYTPYVDLYNGLKSLKVTNTEYKDNSINKYLEKISILTSYNREQKDLLKKNNELLDSIQNKLNQKKYARV